MTFLSDEERYQALSMRYVDAARVVWLSEAQKFVIFSMTRGEIIGACAASDLLSMGELVKEACQRSSEFWAASQQLERQGRWQQGPEEPMEMNAADMGL